MNDAQFLQHLIGQANQTQQASLLARYGQEYMQHRDSFSKWQAEQQRQRQTQQGQQQQKWFNAPEYDPRWKSQVYRDPNDGQWKALPGTPMGTVEKYLAAMGHERDFMEKFAFDPIGTIKPGIEELVREMAGQMLEQQFARHHDSTFSQQFIQENSAWMHQRTPDGQVVLSPHTGRPELSHWGGRFKQHVDALVGQGLRGDQQIAQLAYALTDREYLLAVSQMQAQQGQPQQAAQNGAAQKQQFLQQAAGNGAQNLPQSAVPSPTNANGPAQNPGLPLAQRLLQGFQANGVTDQSIRQSLVRQTA